MKQRLFTVLSFLGWAMVGLLAGGVFAWFGVGVYYTFGPRPASAAPSVSDLEAYRQGVDELTRVFAVIGGAGLLGLLSGGVYGAAQVRRPSHSRF